MKTFEWCEELFEYEEVRDFIHAEIYFFNEEGR